MILAFILYLIGLICIVATLLPLSRHEVWWIRACDFPRLQIVAASLGVLVVLVVAGAVDDPVGQLLALALLGCIAYQLAVILPYARLWRVEIPASRTPPDNRTLSLLVVNVLMSNREADSSAPRDAELVLVAREAAEADGPTIVAGDLNDVAWSHTSRLFQRISRLPDPRIGRGMFNSFHANYRLLRWPRDHVFVSGDFLLRDMQRLPRFGSDHFPILVRLDHHPHAEADRKLEQVASIRTRSPAVEPYGTSPT
jgi:endonuclease/exonuclease/phosphatase (EEP) superfamily protein YafD